MSRISLVLCSLALPVSVIASPLSLSGPTRFAALVTAHGSHELSREDALDAKRAEAKQTPVPKFGSASQWAVAAPSPVARHGGASAVVNQKIYVFGGYGADGSNFIPQRASHVYDPATNAWTALPDMPDAITHAQAAVIGSRIYLGGGELGDGSQQQRVLLSTVHVFNTANNTWSTIPNLPQLRSSGGFVALGTELHYIAGTRPATGAEIEDVDVGDHFVFDTANPGAGWITRAPLPDPRNHFQAIAHAGRIYVIGGQKRHNIPAGDPVGYTYLATSYVYNPGSNSWGTIASLPLPIAELERSSFTFNDKIVIGGGVTSGSQPLDQSYAYDPDTNAWIRWPTLPAKRRSPILQHVNERVIYGTGGGDFDGLRPETAMWTNKIRSDAPRVLFVRGADRSGGFLMANNDAERTEHLGDVDNHSVATSNFGWGQLRALLESEGFVVEQVIEPLAVADPPTGATTGAPVPLDPATLSQYAVVVMGSNNATYGPAAVDALEAYIRARGGVLFVADTNFGSTWSDAANSDNAFLTRFGVSMNQEFGAYELTRTPDYVTPAHPIWLGVDAIDGSGVAPARLGTVPVGVALETLARAEVQTRDNNGSPGTLRPVDANDIAVLAGTVQGGRFVVHFDRDTFVNEKLSATSLAGLDNLDFAVNVFDWLAARRDGVLLSDGFEDPVP